MSKYEKAVAYVNAQHTDTRATIGGIDDNIVYVSTDIGDLRLHEEEVHALAQSFDIQFPANV